MKALVYTDKEGLKVKELPTPEAVPGRVIVKVSNCGICGSDIFLFKSGGLPEGAILGHELSGTVAAVGEGVGSGIKVGDRVIARPAGCGECRFCKREMENICPNRRSIGLGKHPGGFAEYMVADEDQIIPVPEKLGLDQASMADQIGSALHGIKMIGFRKGEGAVVTGAGPIGLCAIMLLKHFGASKILVSELIPERAKQALAFGADALTSPLESSLAKAIWDNYGADGVDCLVECSGNDKATTQAILSAPVGCRIALVGMCMQPITIIPFTLFQKHLSVIGSFGNTQKECIESMDIMASGEIPSANLITKKVSIDELPDAFKMVMNSKVEIKVMMEI